MSEQIEWHVYVYDEGYATEQVSVAELGGDDICHVFEPVYAGQTVVGRARQIAQEHNTYQTLKLSLSALVTLGPPAKTGGFYYVCCSGSHSVHKEDCPWFRAKTLLEELGLEASNGG